MTLYDDLGVDPSADEAAIKKAYRRRAATAHPDVGGSREEFDKISRAKLILLDPRRRQKYDETGEADVAPDNDLANAVEVAVASVDHVLRAIERKSADFCEFQIIKDAQIGLSQDIKKQQDEIRRLDKTVSDLKKIADRMKSKPGRINRLKPVFLARVGDREREKAAKKHAIEIMEKAYEILGDHEFVGYQFAQLAHY